MAVVFWCLSVVCEERFVPALAVVCEVLRIPDDVAGATLMAAGASSPEVFSSLIALFVTHSALGVGTVVGSEIFNHLCICAGSVFFARGKGTLMVSCAKEIGVALVVTALMFTSRRPLSVSVPLVSRYLTVAVTSPGNPWSPSFETSLKVTDSPST